ncbi:hypothetical protein V2J09_010162 [Rumex salicifolius]
MAKVATPGSLASESALLRGGGAMKLKRKTPSELRVGLFSLVILNPIPDGEQLKRRTGTGIMAESSTLLQKSVLADCVSSRLDPPKNTKYVEMRLNEVYPVKKPSTRLRLLSAKANAKENVSLEGDINVEISSSLLYKAQQKTNCQTNTSDSIDGTKHGKEQKCQETEKANKNRFLSVAELSLGSERFAETGAVDMDKALKGLVSQESSDAPYHANSSGGFGDMKQTSPGNICFELNIPGRKVPVDFTLKTFHKLLMSDTYNGISQSSSLHGSIMPHSWVYPQSSLPPFLISTLSSMGGESDFLNKRQVAWEDAFRNLYYLLRKNACDLFYVCAPQFVAMFTAVGGVGKAKRSCSAYISQSTRGLRSLLKEHDISFSMPLCSSKVEEISREDLVELSEIEKHNLGQAKRLISMSDIDNSSQSLLSFHGNENVHNLYDFLLNYKSFLTTSAGLDVPILYSPVPFINASLSAPEIKCKELKTVEHYALQFESYTGKGQSVLDSSAGISYRIEVKGEYLPPWIVSSVCAAMVSSDSSFEASFNTDLNTVGLNTVLKGSNLNSETEEHKDGGGCGSQESSNAYGIPDAIVSHDLHFAPVKSLKYCDGSYSVSLLPS